MSTGHVLVVDDEPDIRELVRDILVDEGYQVEVAANGESARSALRARRPDLILLDIWMPDVDGISLLREWSERGGVPCPVIMISGHGSVETAVEATRLGAYDFIEKPISLAKLLVTVQRALEAGRLRRENEGLRRRVVASAEPMGSSAAMQSLREQAQRVAAHDTWVLIQGEAGTGKETLARYIHAHSSRRAGPFLEIAPGSIPRETASSALFGSEDRGQTHYGLIEQAAGGVLFIDGVADLDPELQLRLSAALARGSFTRVGGASPVSVDVRVIAASSHELETEIKAGRFREELYYQLAVVPLKVPPLRERPEDIADLVRFYADYFPNRDKLPYRQFGTAVLNRMRQHAWPGNARELRNLVQRLLILGQGSEVLIAEVEQALGQSVAQDAHSVDHGIDLNLPLREAREQFERTYLLRQLQEAGGSVGKLAKIVGMERTHLYRKLKDLGIDVRAGGKDD